MLMSYASDIFTSNDRLVQIKISERYFNFIYEKDFNDTLMQYLFAFYS